MTYALVIVVLLFAGTAPCAQEQTINAAKKEGRLVLYTAMQPEDSTKLMELYRNRYPFVEATFLGRAARRY